MELRREWIAWVLVLGGLLRAGLMVAHEPLAGYGNQYDMIRTSACTGYFPALDAPARYQATIEAPVTRYQAEATRPDLCYASTEALLVEVAATVTRWTTGQRRSLELRTVGYVKLAMLAAAALILGAALQRTPSASLAHGLVVFFVVGDPVATLWMNTLYTEFAAIWGLYVVIAALGTLALTDRWSWPVTALLVAAIAALAFSREQMALLPPVLVAAALPWLWYRSRHLATAAFGIALICSLMSFGLLPRPDGVRETNRTDAYLGLLVPASPDPPRALATLGLAPRCEALVGATWYLQRGDDVRATCPEVLRLPSTAFLSLARTEPGTLARATARVVPALGAIVPPYLGILEGARRASLAALPPWLASPLDRLFTSLPAAALACAVLAGVLLAPLALLAALGWGRPSRARHGTGVLMAMLLGITAAYALATTVVGDGWGESARHFLPGALALAAMLASLPAAVPALVANLRDAPRKGAVEAAALALAVAATAAACGLALRWAEAQPIALGVVDEPVTREVKGAFAVKGWAVDPFGVAAIRVTVGERAFEARHGEAPTPDLAKLFPAYADGAHGRFVLDVPAAEAGASGEVPMRVVVRNRLGVETEIDRRRLVVSP